MAYATLTNEISINYKPSDSELSALSDYWNAVDFLIIHDCFSENNPMREEKGGILFWDWVILDLKGFKFPAPIHTCSRTESELYTVYGSAVVLSNEECACVTAYFYLEWLWGLKEGWDDLKNKLHSEIILSMSPAVSKLQRMDKNVYWAIRETLREQFTDKGYRVLD